MHSRHQNNVAPRLTVLGAAIYFALNAMSANAAGVDVYAPSLGGATMDYTPAMGGSSDGQTLVGTQKNTSTGILAAYRWTLLGGKRYLGSLNGGASSLASAARSDASVIVGSANDGAGINFSAYRWDSTNGMVRLADLNGGNYSAAKGVSGNGLLIVGEAKDGVSGNLSAVEWDVNNSTVRALGNLNGGTTSTANAISADGTVAVGSAVDGLTGSTAAVRWVGAAAPESLGHFTDGVNSIATAVSSDGAAVAGYGDSNGAQQAFLWRQVTGIKGLGYLAGGAFSKAMGISANGAVVVGNADMTGGALTGFRWTHETGLQSLIDWLHTNDATYALLPGNSLNHAYAVSADGNTVYGIGTLSGRNQPFVARTYGPIAQPVIPSVPVTPPSAAGTSGGTPGGTSGSTSGGPIGTIAGAGAGGQGSVGVIGLMDLGDSLHNASLYGQAMQALVQGFVQGGLRCETFDMHGICVSTGAVYSSNAGKVNGNNVLGDLSIAYRFSSNWIAGIGYQGPYYKLNINSDSVKSNANTVGAFVEFGNRLRQGVFARAAIAYQQGDATINRTYLTGSGLESSKGDTGIGQRAASAQAGYVFVAGGNIAFMPYVGVDYLKTKIGGYTETTGQFPVRFNSRAENNIYGTVGVNGSINLGGKAIVTAGLKHVQRLTKHNDPVAGDVIGLGSFSIAQDTTERWNEAAIGIQFAGPVKATRVNIGYGHRFASGTSVARDIAAVSFTMGF
ncbi:autotransporter domain-containing protein [Cupriavidus sp. TMH.W2]|uniref:autotransporter domain-containing protein n=1 Tax=Cupriavidus sp. TMH.W2 TaxID=3434465 RepID=UPI003D7705E8